MLRSLSLAVVLILSGLAGAAPLRAQELVFGAGYSSYNRKLTENSAVLSVEWAGRPLTRWLGGDLALHIAADVHGRGDAYAGAGLRLRWGLDADWFIDAGIMPGLYRASSPANTLGGGLQFRSHLAIGLRLSPVSAVSLAASHKSNARLNRVNPGLNTLQLRWHRSF